MRRLLAGLAVLVLAPGLAPAAQLVCRAGEPALRCGCVTGGGVLLAPAPPAAPDDCAPAPIRRPA